MAKEALSISLENDCTIYEVAEKHNQILQQWPKSNQPIQFDLQAVTDMDVCFIQMLISCRQSARNQQLAFELHNVSEELLDKFTRLAAVNLLECIC